MFCNKCGKELPDGSVFCSFCGEKLGEFGQEKTRIAKQDAEPVDTQPRPTSEVADSEHVMRGIIGKNADYYITQFGRLQEDEKNKINWASFFLSIYHASYRGVWKEWLNAMKLPLIAWLLGIVVMCVSSVSGSLAAMMVVPTLISLIGIWLFVKNILTAKRFNRIYMAHIENKISLNDQTPDPSGKRVVLAILAAAVIGGIVSLCTTISTEIGLETAIGSAFDEASDSSKDDYTVPDYVQKNLDDLDKALDNMGDNAAEEPEDYIPPDQPETEDSSQTEIDTTTPEQPVEAPSQPVQPSTEPAQPVQPRAEPSQPVNAVGNDFDSSSALWGQIANDVLSNYVYGLTNAINNGDFSYVSDVFVPGSAIYNEQSGLVQSLSNQGYEEEVIDFYIVSSNMQDANYGTVTSYEEIGVYTPSGDYKVVEQSYTYYLERQSDGGWLMYKMEEVT